MIQKIEIWKVLLLMVQAFCFGGYVFTGEDRRAKIILSVIMCIVGIVILCVI